MYVCTYIHTYIHTHTHTHIHTVMYRLIDLSWVILCQVVRESHYQVVRESHSLFIHIYIVCIVVLKELFSFFTLVPTNDF